MNYRTAAAVAVLGAYCALTAVTNHYVPDAYMDEPFHVPQTQAYCRGEWDVWDPKITTFPGLYLVGRAWAAALEAANALTGTATVDACSGRSLRYVNALLSAACVYLFWDIAAALARRRALAGSAGVPLAGCRWLLQPATPAHYAALLAAYPLHAFYAPLYYTDPGALAALLACYALLLHGRTHAAAVAAAAAVAFRQTNAVWVAFLLGASLLQEGEAARGRRQRKAPTRAARAAGAGPPSSPLAALVAELDSVLRTLWEDRARLAALYAPLAAVPAAFVAFVAVQGGVAVGDRAAHAPVAHAMQLHYCALWVAAAALPLLLAGGAPPPQRSGALSAATGAALAAAGAAVVAGTMLRYTLAHPYLLADNRHYMFYLWRRLLGHPRLRWALVPAYVAGWGAIGRGLLRARSALWCLGLLACCTATLVPAGLLEPRYFTVPFVLVVLHLPPAPRWAVLLTAAAYLAVDVATWYLFMQRPFTWPDGSVARFMW